MLVPRRTHEYSFWNVNYFLLALTSVGHFQRRWIEEEVKKVDAGKAKMFSDPGSECELPVRV